MPVGKRGVEEAESGKSPMKLKTRLRRENSLDLGEGRRRDKKVQRRMGPSDNMHFWKGKPEDDGKAKLGNPAKRADAKAKRKECLKPKEQRICKRAKNVENRTRPVSI